MSGCLEGTHHQWPGFVDGTKISEQIYCFIPTFNLRLQASLLSKAVLPTVSVRKVKSTYNV